MGFEIGAVTIYSNDGKTFLFNGDSTGVASTIEVVKSGAFVSSAEYFYTGDKIFIGLALSPNKTIPDFSIGTSFYAGDYVDNATSDLNLYIVERGIAKTFNLSKLGLSVGTHSVTVKARAIGYGDSDSSNVVSYEPPYTVSGTWEFNEELDFSHYNNGNESGYLYDSLEYRNLDYSANYIIYFISNNVLYNNIAACYGGDGDTDALRVVYKDGIWIKEKCREIIFVRKQIVSKEFYEWLTANAKKTSENTHGGGSH